MTKLQSGTFKIGVAMALGLALIRSVQTQTMADLFLTGGLALVEIACVWVLEYKARQIEPEIDLWNAEVKAQEEGVAVVKAAKEDLDRHQTLIDEIEQAMEEIEDELMYEREIGDPKVLTTIAVNSVRHGYLTGLASNAGEMGGVKLRKEVA